MRWLLLLTIGVTLALPLRADDAPLPRPGFSLYGCTIEPVDVTKDNQTIRRYVLSVWAEYPPDSKKEFQFAEGYYKQRKKAMERCDKWMKRVEYTLPIGAKRKV